MLTYGGAHSLDDPHLCEWIKEIVQDYEIKVIVETGTNEGLSTAKFARMVPSVVSIDVDPDCTKTALEHLKREGISANVALITGHSPDALKHLAKDILEYKCLIFLDAHMTPSDAWPVLDEIDAIPRGTGVLMFHDIKVPDRDFAYSQFVHPDGAQRDFTYESIREKLTAWSPDHFVEYNRTAEGSRVGVMMVTP